MTDRSDALIHRLQLQPHPEGGHYREVFRSPQQVRDDRGDRTAVTTIYFLLRSGEVSRWHRVTAVEIWHFYEGDPLELLSYDPATDQLTRFVLGPEQGESQAIAVVPAHHWQAARPLGVHSLVGCTVAPGFEFRDFAFVGDLPNHQAAFQGTLMAFGDLL